MLCWGCYPFYYKSILKGQPKLLPLGFAIGTDEKICVLLYFYGPFYLAIFTLGLYYAKFISQILSRFEMNYMHNGIKFVATWKGHYTLISFIMEECAINIRRTKC